MAHELAHIVRGDCGWQLLERVVDAVLWFHPLVWCAGRRIALVRERICDGFAVHHLGRRQDYVETLLEMATRLTSRRGLSLGLAVLRTSQLGARLASVQDCKGLKRCQVRPAARWAILLLTAAAALWAGRAAVAVEPVPQVAGLPSDAQALLDGYQKKSALLQAEIDRQVAEERDSLIKSLQALQDDYTRQARLDEAVAIRDQLRIIKSKMATAGQSVVPPAVVGMGPPGGMPAIRPPRGMPGFYPGITRAPTATPEFPGHGTTVAPSTLAPSDADSNPLSMTPFRNSMGKVLLVEVSGSTFGAVWGDSEVVTDDSSLATAAVQFGVLKPGERGMIKVTICPAKKKYAGFSQHGVTSQPWDNAGPYVSLKIEAAPAGAFQACHDYTGTAPGGVTVYPVENENNVTLDKFVGSTFLFQITGQVNANLWGTDQYTHDSSLGAAAVHAGALQAGQSGYVFMNVKKGIPFYLGSSRNGVTSSDWNNAGGNYVTLTFQSTLAVARRAATRVLRDGYEYGNAAPGKSPRTETPFHPVSEASPDLFRRSVGQTLYFNVTGSSDGSVWGSNPYTDDSSLAAAAVHSGLLQRGEHGTIQVCVEPALNEYPGSMRHGVTSQDWNSGGGYVALHCAVSSGSKTQLFAGKKQLGHARFCSIPARSPATRNPPASRSTSASPAAQAALSGAPTPIPAIRRWPQPPFTPGRCKQAKRASSR